MFKEKEEEENIEDSVEIAKMWFELYVEQYDDVLLFGKWVGPKTIQFHSLRMETLWVRNLRKGWGVQTIMLPNPVWILRRVLKIWGKLLSFSLWFECANSWNNK